MRTNTEGFGTKTSSVHQLRLLAKIKYGSVPEWPKGADCKSVVFDFGGSNPPAPTKQKDLLRQVFLFGGMKRSLTGTLSSLRL